MPNQNAHLTRVVAVTGGKGGIGKTCLTLNLALSLAKQGLRAMLLDADLGLANVDVLLGLNCPHTLADVVRGKFPLEEILVQGPLGITLIPAASGVQEMADLRLDMQREIVSMVSALPNPPDVLLIDTAAGIGNQVVRFAQAANDVIVVVCNEPTSLADAYATIKVLSQQGIKKFYVLANMLRQPENGKQLFHKLRNVVDRFLQADLLYLGSVPYDEHMRLAVQQQSALLEKYPGSAAAHALTHIAKQMLAWPSIENVDGKIAFYYDNVISTHHADKDVV